MQFGSAADLVRDSISPWDRPCSRAASMDWRCRTMRPASSTNTGMRAAPRRSTGPGLACLLAFDRKHMPQAFFEQIGPMQPGIGLGDPGQLGGLAFGEVLGVFPQRIPGALLSRQARSWAGRGAVFFPGRPRPHLGSLRAIARVSFQARRRSASRASVAQATTWNGSAQRIAPGQRSATTSAIQSAASAETWVICAHRWVPRASKPSQGGGVAPGRPTPAGRSRDRPPP